MPVSCEMLSRGQMANHQPRLQVKEGHRAVLELGADDPLGGEAEPIAIEPQGLVKVIDA